MYYGLDIILCEHLKCLKALAALPDFTFSLTFAQPSGVLVFLLDLCQYVASELCIVLEHAHDCFDFITF